MKIIPHNNHVLCKCITNNKKTLASGFVYETNDVMLYEVISISNNIKDDTLNLAIGDIVRTNSVGTCINSDDGEYYLFNIENIAGKVIQ
jgi:co-chaperonin GroES (HSP10)